MINHWSLENKAVSHLPPVRDIPELSLAQLLGRRVWWPLTRGHAITLPSRGSAPRGEAKRAGAGPRATAGTQPTNRVLRLRYCPTQLCLQLANLFLRIRRQREVAAEITSTLRYKLCFSSWGDVMSPQSKPFIERQSPS